MNYFDLHCDTLFEMYRQNKHLLSSDLMVSLDKADFENYTQVLAIYSENTLSDNENYDSFLSICDYFDKEKESLPENFSYILAVEGGKLLFNDINRLDVLYEKGVRILTLVWGGECRIGGAHNTDSGLTSFGRKVLYRMFSLGMIPDLSHASDRMFRQVADIAKRENIPFIASHSNSRSVCKHTRNITDDMFSSIISAGGLCGINLYPDFLCPEPEKADISSIIAHIKHFLSLGGESFLSMGCDFDGIGRTPIGVSSVADIPGLYREIISRGIPKSAADKIFYENAKRFFNKNKNFNKNRNFL